MPDVNDDVLNRVQLGHGTHLRGEKGSDFAFSLSAFYLCMHASSETLRAAELHADERERLTAAGERTGTVPHLPEAASFVVSLKLADDAADRRRRISHAIPAAMTSAVKDPPTLVTLARVPCTHVRDGLFRNMIKLLRSTLVVFSSDYPRVKRNPCVK